MKSVTVCLALLFLSTPLRAEEYAWVLRRQGDVQIHTRKVEGSSLLEFKGETTINSPLETALALFEDDRSVSKWFFNSTQPEALEQNGERKIYYVRADLPWPFRDRDTAYERTKSTNATSGAVEYRIKALPKRVPLKRGVVRVLHMDIVWRFTPMPGGKTEVYYQQHSNPRGFFAPVVINHLAVEIPLRSLQNFRKLAERKGQR